MKKLLLLLIIPFLSFGQSSLEEGHLLKYLIEYDKENSEWVIGEIPSESILKSIGAFEWVKNNMWEYDFKSLEETLNKSRDKASHYSDMCDVEFQLIDGLLNKYYQILKIIASEEEFDLIQDNQRAWIKYRDGWKNESENIYKNLNGYTGNLVDAWGHEAKIYYERIDQFKTLINWTLTEE
jgi:uncharacterized protein YecT (DUF1311 family)